MTTLIQHGMIEPGLATVAQLQTMGNIFVGMEADFPFVPTDPWWLPMFGQTVLIGDYPVLFAKLGTQYGGNGTTNFRLPDNRGRVRAGLDNMGGTSANRLTGQAGGLNGDILGQTGGAETHLLATTQLPAHNHTGSVTINAGGLHKHTVARGGTGGGDYTQTGTNATSGSIDTSEAGSHIHTGSISINNAGGGQAHNNVQPTITTYACILAYWPF